MIFFLKTSFTTWANRFFSLISFIFLFSLSSIAWSLPEFRCPEIVSCIDPYLGVDMGVRYMAWKKDFGDNVYNRTAYQPNIYAGLKFNQFFGVEAGYEEILFKKRDIVLNNGSEVTVLDVTFETPISARSSVKLKGWHFDVTGTCPLWCDQIELLGTVGIASLKTIQQFTLIATAGGPIIPTVRTFSKSKIVPRISAGFQYKMTDYFSLRAILIGIENTSLFDNLGSPQEDPTSDSRTRMRHNTYHSIGVLFHF